MTSPPPTPPDPPAPAPTDTPAREPDPAAVSTPPGRGGWRGVVLSLVVSALILLAGFGAYAYLTGNPKTSQRKPVTKTARLVEVMPAVLGDHPVTVAAMGESRAARQIDLPPQVGGRVVKVWPALIPGGRFAQGEPLAEIDRADYELALRQRESEVHQARSAIETARAGLITAQRELALEQGNQAVSKREFELLGQDIAEEDRALILREPQLQAAQAEIGSAQAAVNAARSSLSAAENRREQAQLDLERTSVRVPFDAVVLAKLVEVGDVVSTATPLATLVGTDQAWVEVSVPAADLRWITLPAGDRPGSAVEIRQDSAWGPDATRSGRVIQLLPQLESEGRMARVLIAVDDPLALDPDVAAGTPALLMGAYVRVRITGPTVTGVVRLPRAVLWNDATVRLMNDNDALEIRPVNVLYKEPDHVLIRNGLTAGDRVITTDLGVAVNGLPLRLDATTAAAGAAR